MLNDAAKKWVAALRSGKYKQGMGALYKRGAYCCLGVAECVVLGYPKSGDSSLSSSATTALGLNSNEGGFTTPVDGEGTYQCLISLNDEARWSFEKIADFIESEPDGLFVQVRA